MDIQEEIERLFEELANDGIAPVLTAHRVTAYHGTTIEAARKIVDTQIFKPSVKGLLGPGVYFYENAPRPGIEVALDWARHRHFPDAPKAAKVGAAVVVADLNLTSVLDMTNLRNRPYLNRLLNWLVMRARLEGADVVRKINEHTVGRLIRQSAPENAQIEGVRHFFAPPSFRHQKQFGLVVHEKKCIANIRHFRKFT